MSKSDQQGQIYCVYMSDGTSHAIGNVEKVSFADREFLKGKDLAEKSWARGKIKYVYLDNIIGMIEFDSYEEYYAAAKAYEKNHKPKSKKARK